MLMDKKRNSFIQQNARKTINFISKPQIHILSDINEESSETSQKCETSGIKS